MVKRYEKMEREKERMARKYNIPTENPLTLPWCFDRWYEKLILFAMTILAMWKLLDLIVV